MNLRTIALINAALIQIAFGFSPAQASESYPERPVRFILPYPAGGTTDILGRTIAQRLSDRLKQQFIVDNRPGGDGIIAYSAVAGAKPDGYTVLLMATSFTVNPSLHNNLPFDPIKSFSAVGLAAVVTNLVAAHPSVPAKSIGDLISLARSHPDKLNYAGSGAGTASVLGMQLLKNLTKTRMTLIPYRGTPALITDLVSGQVDLTLNSLPGLLPYVRNRYIRPLAVTGQYRSKVLPDIPTVSESGYPDFEANTWYGVLSPAGVPQGIIKKLNAEINSILKLNDVSDLLLKAGFEVSTNSPEQFSALIENEIKKWGDIVRQSKGKK